MSRIVFAGIFVMLILGCQTGPEGFKMQPLPPGGQPLAYADAIHRARSFATSATEAFYVDKWADVEIAAVGLEETARILPKSPDIPMSLQGTLASQSTALLTDVQSLRESAKKKDEDKTNELLQRIHLRVRKMRPE